MSKLNRLIVKASVFAPSSLLALSEGTWGQAQEVSAKTPELYFYTRPSKQLFWLGEPIVRGLQLYSRSEQPILVSHGALADFAGPSHGGFRVKLSCSEPC